MVVVAVGWCSKREDGMGRPGVVMAGGSVSRSNIVVVVVSVSVVSAAFVVLVVVANCDLKRVA